MNPTNLGRQNGALVLEVLKVLGRPATSYEVAERVSDVYRLPLLPIRPVVTDVLEGGLRQGFFSCSNGRYSVVQPVVDQLGRDIDQYAVEILAGRSAAGALPQMSPLMLKLQQLDGSPPMVFVDGYRRTVSGEQRERMPSGDVPLDARLLMLPVSPLL
ncbi:uncharacterized protein LOC128266584 [Drosophila gunungcola]|uniref:uncharacterized protein LOC128266584 n=1 Tax=Drosophila gunungcola TaxID=103775 RepID=UPI0022E3FE9F|nr:uncharacterized protein LOC128266584 [Drosophila gunungcola]